jgi:hypothetical protein
MQRATGMLRITTMIMITDTTTTTTETVTAIDRRRDIARASGDRERFSEIDRDHFVDLD